MVRGVQAVIQLRPQSLHPLGYDLALPVEMGLADLACDVQPNYPVLLGLYAP